MRTYPRLPSYVQRSFGPLGVKFQQLGCQEIQKETYNQEEYQNLFLKI